MRMKRMATAIDRTSEVASLDLATAAVLPWSADPARGEGLLVKAKPLE